MNNIHIHPSLTPVTYVLTPYYFEFSDESIGMRQSYGGGDTSTVSKILDIVGNITVQCFHEIGSAVCNRFGIDPDKAMVEIEPVGYEMYDEGFVYGHSILVTVNTGHFMIEISFDCHATINAFQWGKNAGAWE